MKNNKILENLANLLIKYNKTLGIAESCTGGLLMHQITNVSGSSKFFKGGIVCYSNFSKINILNVPSSIIERFGAVSKECAIQMAYSVKNLFASDIGVGITGIAGPTGGTFFKPIGTVYIAIVNNNILLNNKFNFTGNRLEIKNKTANKTIELIIDSLNL